MDIREAFAGWKLALVTERRSARTIENYSEAMKPFLEHLASTGISDTEQLTSPVLREYIADRFAGLAPATQRGRVAIVKRFGAWLSEEDICQNDPFRKVKRPTPHGVEDARLLAPAQVRRILDMRDQRDPEQFRDYVIITLCVDVGLRRGEVCSARLGELNLEEGSLRVHGKGDKSRLVPLSDQLRSLLWKYVHKVRPKQLAEQILRGRVVDETMRFPRRPGVLCLGPEEAAALDEMARSLGMKGETVVSRLRDIPVVRMIEPGISLA